MATLRHGIGITRGSKMEILRTVEQQGVIVVQVGSEYGSADSSHLEELEQHLFSGISRASTSLLVDCKETTYLGCGFINSMLRCHQQAQLFNVKIVLCSLNPLIMQVFKTSHLDSIWLIFKTRHEAMAEIQDPNNKIMPVSIPSTD